MILTWISKKKNEKRFINEISHFEKVFDGRLTQEVPESWERVENHFAALMEKRTGVRNLFEYVGMRTKGKSKIKLLGLGSGACGVEFEGIAPVLAVNNTSLELDCLDINDAILKQAEEEAGRRGIPFRGIMQDANEVRLPQETYDVIVAYASLHHFKKLDHIAKEINRALKPDGYFVTVDIPSRNGFRMWDETYKVVKDIWNTLPDRFKIDHTAYHRPKRMKRYRNPDYSKKFFECINSEAIIPALRTHLKEVDFVQGLSLARRFFDAKYGPNFDLSRPLDRAVFDYVLNLDDHYLETGLLKPETFFGAYEKRIDP